MGYCRKPSSIASPTLATFALLAVLLAFGAPRARANDCQERIRHADHALHEAAAKHGWDSPQAADRRRELNEARAYCWEHGHRWWDEDEHRWRSEHDWDERDHDRH